MVERPVDLKIVASELVKRVNEDSRRIRLLEQRIDRVDNAASGLEDNTLSELGNLKILIEKLSGEIMRMGEKLTIIENDISKLRRDLDKTATKAEIKKLEIFIDLLNPITSKFVTKDEMERMLEETMAKPKKA